MQDLLSLFSDVTVRACFRSASRSASLTSSHGHDISSGRLQIVHGVDAADPATLGAAFEGCSGAVIVTPHDPAKHSFAGDDELSNNMVRAAVASGVKRIVYVGSWTAVLPASMIGSRFASTEKLLGELGAEGKITFSSLRSGYFHENYAPGARATLAKGIFAWPAELPLPSVDPRDMGSVAAALLAKNQPLRNDHLQISGPELETAQSLSEKLGKALGVTLNPVNPPLPTFLGLVPPYLHELFTEILKDKQILPLSTAVKDVTGKDARGFGDWLKDHAHLFKAN